MISNFTAVFFFLKHETFICLSLKILLFSLRHNVCLYNMIVFDVRIPTACLQTNLPVKLVHVSPLRYNTDFFSHDVATRKHLTLLKRTQENCFDYKYIVNLIDWLFRLIKSYSKNKYWRVYCSWFTQVS